METMNENHFDLWKKTQGFIEDEDGFFFRSGKAVEEFFTFDDLKQMFNNIIKDI